MPFKTMAEIRAANEAAGENWFSRSTMRYWKSRVHGGARKGKYFITSERDFRDTTRLFSIREAMPDGSISTVGEFQKYKTLAEARKALKELAQ